MAPRKSKSDPLLKQADMGSQPTSFHADGAAPSSSPRSSTSARHMSLKQLATFLNLDRNTVMKYLDQGMPTVEKADRDRGVAWVIDSAEAVRWLEERAAKNVADRFGGDLKTVSKEDAERRDAVAKMIIREVDTAESAKMVAKISSILDLIRRDYTELRSRLTSIPDTIAGKVDSKISAKVRDIAEEQIRGALAALVADAQIADCWFPRRTEPVGRIISIEN